MPVRIFILLFVLLGLVSCAATAPTAAASACKRYQQFVSEGQSLPSPWERLKNQVFLGDDRFLRQMQQLVDPDKSLDEVPHAQKRHPPKLLSQYQASTTSRNDAILQAWLSGGYKMKEIADYFGLHYSSVSKIIRAAENSRFKA